METQYTWKTKMFSRKFEIYLNDNLIGELRKREWSGKYAGEMNGKQFLFATRGFFRRETRIIDQADNSVTGTINFTFWKRKSQIAYQDKEYKWQFDNFWQNEWSLSNENGYLVKYHSHGFKGTITSYTDDTALILAGFFIRNYFKQRSAEVAAAT
jgi:hypothetical protein